MAEPSFHVVTDGACDLPDEMDIDPPRAPLSLAFGDEQFASDELTPAEFYDKLARSPHHPSTSQPAPADFAALYRAASDKPILSLHISDGLSGTLNAARQALDEVPDAEVHLHDTKTLSVGQAFQVYAACEAARRGESLEVAKRWVERVREATHLLFTIDTLEYLQRGGRIGRVRAALGSLLSLKPVVYVDKETGTYVSVGRARTFPKAIQALVRKVGELVPEGAPLRVAIAYGDDRSEADGLLALLRERFELHWVGFAPIGPTLAVHTGPKALGLCVAAGPWPWEADAG